MRTPIRHHGQRGFTFLWVLFAIAVLGIGLVATSEVVSTTARRQKLAELDWAGSQFTQAIASYYHATRGEQQAYPPRLQDLLEDRRYAVMRRHLREIYRNPFTGQADWALLTTNDGCIRGIRARWTTGNDSTTKDFVFQP